jgi:hypothetical protein
MDKDDDRSDYDSSDEENQQECDIGNRVQLNPTDHVLSKSSSSEANINKILMTDNRQYSGRLDATSSSGKYKLLFESLELVDLTREDDLWYVSDVLRELKDSETNLKMMAFARFASAWVEDCDKNHSFTFADVIKASKLYDLQLLKKEKEEFTVLVALWVVFLRVFRIHNIEVHHRYPSVDAFLQTYEGQFFDKPEDGKELVKLFETANWMAILLPMLVAKKSKGLVLQVIPKLLEGFQAKYVTGSGQSKATSNRVRIFEFEGNVQPCKKRKWGGKELNSRDGDEDSVVHKKKSRTPFKSLARKSSPPEAEKPSTVEIERAVAAFAATWEKNNRGSRSIMSAVSADDSQGFSHIEIEKFKRDSFYSAPPALHRDWSEEFYANHFDIDIDQLL